ncbi:MAG: hypothetical protein FWC33_06085 [Candidatus Bathyarchaeota archaeon]|nr:hypothetical protein [Candidatus Termiticorpusculum sp.]
MPILAPFPTRNARTEDGEAVSVVLGGTGVSTTGIFPTAVNNQNIQHIKLILKVFASTTNNFKASDVFGGWKLTKGAETRFDISSYQQLERLYNILTRQNFSAKYIKDEEATQNTTTGQKEATLELNIPLTYGTTPIPVSYFNFKPLSAIGATSGSVSVSLKYYYTDEKVSDVKLQIKTIPVIVQNNVDSDISSHLPTEFIDEIFLDVTSNSNLNEQSYVLGAEPQYKYNNYDLALFTAHHENLKQIDGFFQLRCPSIAWALSATVGTKPKLNINLAQPMQPVIYMLQNI